MIDSLCVGVDIKPTVEQIGTHTSGRQRSNLYLLQPDRDVLYARDRPNAVAKYEFPAVCVFHKYSVILDYLKWDQRTLHHREVLVEQHAG